MPVKTKNRRVQLPPKVFPADMAPPEPQATRRSEPPSPTLLRIPEVARELAVSERTIADYLKQGLLERVQIGTRTVRISRASLNRLMGQAAE
jgi:excisionase family DNA binding protein